MGQGELGFGRTQIQYRPLRHSTGPFLHRAGKMGGFEGVQKGSGGERAGRRQSRGRDA